MSEIRNVSAKPENKLPTIKTAPTAAKPPRKLTAAQPTLEEKADIVEELNDLLRRREVLMSSLDDVAGYYISPSGGCQMRVTDSNNKAFSISHPLVIEEVLKQVTFKLEEELKKVEARFMELF